MKRERSENSVDNSTDAKHSKCDNDDPLTPFMKDFNEIQDGIEKLDMKCAFEQMNIQKQFDEQKRPLFERRGKIIEQIPGFWATTLKKHPALCDIIPDDIEILKHIVRLDLKDNMDNNGSYKITFEFSEGASEYFEPLTLVKHVTFDNKQERIVECTKIKWKDGKDPIAAVKKQRSRYGNELPAWSVFEWFTNEDCPDLPDVGEIIRREIWHNPITFYLGIEETGDDYEDEDGEDNGEDDDDDDEEDEEEEDDEEEDDEEDEEEEEEEDKSETKK